MRLPENFTILLAEDDPDDQFLIAKAFEKIQRRQSLHIVENGVDLMDYLHYRGKYQKEKSGPRPSLILLDLNMPKKDGHEVIGEIKADINLRLIPVVVLTTSNAQEDIVRSYELGASSFITKPTQFDSLCDAIKTLCQYWMNTVAFPHAG